MAYDLDRFCADARAILQYGDALAANLTRIGARLAELLANPVFVAFAFTEDTPPGQRLLFHDVATDFHVLAHVQRGGKSGTPHSHGTSWAIYGNARGFTDMTEWRRVNPETEEQAVLEQTAKYGLRDRPHPRLSAACHPCDRPSREGLGHPRDRHRSRPFAAFPLSSAARQDRGACLVGWVWRQR